MMQEVYNHAGYFESKIVLNYLWFWVYWPKIATDVRKYIWGYLPCIKWTTLAWSILLTPIQTGEPYELKGIDFIGRFEKSAYGNNYIYNLGDFFSKHMYLYPISDTCINDVIILFDYYLRANLKLYAVYMDAGLHFTSHKFRMYSQTKDIAVVFTPSASHKSIDMIKKSSNIL